MAREGGSPTAYMLEKGVSTKRGNGGGTHDQAFCMKVLGSDPRTKNAALRELVQITIDLGLYIATGTKVKIKSPVLSEKDPILRSHFVTCDEYYGNAISSLREAVSDLKRGEYKELGFEGGISNADANDCEDEFKRPPTYKSPLAVENRRLGLFGEIIVIIANLLNS
ncbi:hypothetical protein DH2020_019298 [Rehmannia glutinosa]|uniref:Pectinesterase inhibitor domain-containing protein n=1 Tax=Rehmannia glutinosa TaxID=99300 RepID=A0ABR0WLE8_REHGL